MKVTIKLLETRKAKKLLKRADKLSLKGLRAGLNKALAIVKRAIRKETKHKSIKKAVGSKVSVKKSGATGKFGLNIGKKKGKGYAPHGAIYILGTKPRTQTKTGRSTGRTKGHDIVKAGTAKSQKRAVKEMHEAIRLAIKKAKKR